MERIIVKMSRIFYFMMFCAHIKVVADNVVKVHIPMLILLFASLNVFLYAVALYHSLKRHYVQGKRILYVISATTMLQWLYIVVRNILSPTGSVSICLDSVIQCFLIEWILWFRIATVNRLIEIANRKNGTKWGGGDE